MLYNGVSNLLRLMTGRRDRCSGSQPLVMALDELLSQRHIPVGDQHGGITGGIEAVSPAAGFVDRQRSLVVATMKVAISPYMVTRIDGVIEFCLQEDLDLLALLGLNG